MEILFIDCCIRREESRTRMLCDFFLSEMKKNHPGVHISHLSLQDEDLQYINEERLRERDKLARQQKWEEPVFTYAKQFANADRIVVGAPYWDLSFPSLLKIYLENIFVCNITFFYDGPKSVGKCKAKSLTYIQSAGGLLSEQDPGALYMKDVCLMLGISDFQWVFADGLDIIELPQGPRMELAMDRLTELAQKG